MKRLICLMMALAIICSLFIVGSPAVSAETEPKTLTNTPDDTTASTPEPTPQPTPEPTPEPTTEPTPEATPETTPEPTPEATPETTPEPTPEATPDPSIPSAGPFTFSKSGLSFVKSFEGFTLYPTWDYAQWTVGYGTKCPSDKLSYYKEHGITKEEAEVLLAKEIESFSYQVNKFVTNNKLMLTQNQFDALVSFSYNVGYAWMYDSTGMMWQAVVHGWTGNDFIRAIGRWSLAGGEVLTGLLRRRLCEANMYLNGLYSTSAPTNYCYVLYNGNGGSVSPKSQCYDSNNPAQILGEATLSGKNFVGWFTAKVGGEEVTVLDASVRNKTIYARWALDGVVEDGKLAEPVTVTVTAYSVNLRNGPGTNYGIVGGTYQGKTMVITHVVKGGDYLWGMSGDRWIALEFTNYAQVAPQPPEADATEPPVTEPAPTDPDATEPPATEPSPTEPPATEPPVTNPPATEPPATEPPTTNPPATEPPATEPEEEKVMGTVNASAGLMIRSGPGTGYSTVGSLKNHTRVEILEQKNVGTMVWGRIAKGWISLTYVKLDKPLKPEVEQAILTGTVNCYCLIVRKGAGSSNGIADYLYQGDKVQIFEKKTVSGTTWGRIEGGWVSLDFITLDKEVSTPVPPVTNPPATEPAPTEPPATNPPATEPPVAETNKVMGTVNAPAGLMIRSGAGSSYGSVGALTNGTRVEILEQKKVGSSIWGRISRGWICLDYVKLDKPVSDIPTATEPAPTDPPATESTPTEPPVTEPAPTDPPAESGKVTGTVKADPNLCIRKGPGTSYGVVGAYYSGAKVTILEQTTVGGVTWGKTDKGWISLSFVVLDNNSGTTQKVYRTVNTYCLIVRSGAGTNYSIASYLYSGTKVEILEQKTVSGVPWGRISSGWICLDFTK